MESEQWSKGQIRQDEESEGNPEHQLGVMADFLLT